MNITRTFLWLVCSIVKCCAQFGIQSLDVPCFVQFNPIVVNGREWMMWFAVGEPR